MDGFVIEQEKGFVYRIVDQQRPVPGPNAGLWIGRIRIGGQDAVPEAVRLQIVDASDGEGIVYLDRPQVMGLIKALLMTLGEVESGEGIQEA